MKKEKYLIRVILILGIILIFSGCATTKEKKQKAAPIKKVTPEKEAQGTKEISKEKSKAPVAKKIYLLKKEIVYFPDGSIDTIKEYTYNNKGNALTEVQETPEGELISKIQYDYIDDNIHKKTVYNDGKEEVLTYYIYTFKEGNLYSITQYDSKNNIQTVSKYKYDNSGNKVLWEVFNGKGIKMGFTKYYYNNGKIVKKEIYGPNGSLESYIEIKYSGNKKSKEEYFDSQGKLEKYIIYEYNGDLLQKELYYKSTGDIIRTVSYKYDSNNYVNLVVIKDSNGNTIEKIKKVYSEFSNE